MLMGPALPFLLIAVASVGAGVYYLAREEEEESGGGGSKHPGPGGLKLPPSEGGLVGGNAVAGIWQGEEISQQTTHPKVLRKFGPPMVTLQPGQKANISVWVRFHASATVCHAWRLEADFVGGDISATKSFILNDPIGPGEPFYCGVTLAHPPDHSPKWKVEGNAVFLEALFLPFTNIPQGKGMPIEDVEYTVVEYDIEMGWVVTYE